APIAARNARITLVALGGALYIAYVIVIGGDFMEGRFFTAPILLAVLILIRQPRARLWWRIATVCAVVLGLSVHDAPLRVGKDYGKDDRGIQDDHQVGDERKFYYPHTGLLPADFSALY